MHSPTHRRRRRRDRWILVELSKRLRAWSRRWGTARCRLVLVGIVTAEQATLTKEQFESLLKNTFMGGGVEHVAGKVNRAYAAALEQLAAAQKKWLEEHDAELAKRRDAEERLAAERDARATLQEAIGDPLTEQMLCLEAMKAGTERSTDYSVTYKAMMVALFDWAIGVRNAALAASPPDGSSARAEVVRLKDVIRKFEFGVRSGWTGDFYCVGCGRYRDEGHRADCQIREALQ